MAPLVKEFEKHPEDFKTIVCVTGQHREMLDQVLRIFDIRPDYDLNIMKQGQDLYDVTSKVLLGMRDVLKEARPDVVLVHGDAHHTPLRRFVDAPRKSTKGLAETDAAGKAGRQVGGVEGKMEKPLNMNHFVLITKL